MRLKIWPVICLISIGISACSPKQKPTSEIAPLDGHGLYNTRCAACHQMNGAGIPGNCPPLQASPTLSASQENLIKLVLLGKKGPLNRDGVTYNGIMPAWRYDLNDDQIASVLNFLQKEWGSNSETITPKAVAEVREATKKDKNFQ